MLKGSCVQDFVTPCGEAAECNQLNPPFISPSHMVASKPQETQKALSGRGPVFGLSILKYCSATWWMSWTRTCSLCRYNRLTGDKLKFRADDAGIFHLKLEMSTSRWRQRRSRGEPKQNQQALCNGGHECLPHFMAIQSFLETFQQWTDQQMDKHCHPLSGAASAARNVISKNLMGTICGRINMSLTSILLEKEQHCFLLVRYIVDRDTVHYLVMSHKSQPSLSAMQCNTLHYYSL